jgi:hypothetical protein
MHDDLMHAREREVYLLLSKHGVGGGGYIDVINCTCIHGFWMMMVWQEFQGNGMSSAEMLCYYTTGIVLCMLHAACMCARRRR